MKILVGASPARSGWSARAPTRRPGRPRVGQAEPVQLGRSLAEQAVLARVARRAGRRQHITAGAATGVGNDLGQLGDIAELAWLAQLALANRAGIRIAHRHQPVGDLLPTGSLLDLGGDALA